jgi:DNA invertase Pin-like site-specific DNA recombinase
VEIFTDLDVSGGKRARKGYDAMIARIKAGGISVVAAYDQSRAFRSTLIAAEFKALLDEPAYKAIEIVFVHGSFDRSPVGGFSYSVLAAAHEMERRMVGEKIKAAYKYLIASGAAAGRAPLGYRRTPEMTLTVDEDEAAIVRRIFEDYATGEHSARAVAIRLNDEGIKRPHARSKYGWLPDTIVDTLRNVRYIGKTYSINSERREGQLIKAQWPAIIDEAMFKRVQEIMGTRKAVRRPRPAHYIFGRLLVCARCGQVMWATRRDGHSYYFCRRDVVMPCSESSKAIREDVMLAWANGFFAKLHQDGPTVTATDQIARSIARSVVGLDEPKRRPVVRSLASIEEALERLELSWVGGRVSDATYAIERARYEELRKQIAEASAPPVPLPDYSQLLTDWRSADPALQRRTLTRLFEALYVEDGDVKRYKPRREYRTEVGAIIDKVTADGGFTWQRPTIRPGRPTKSPIYMEEN